MPSTTDKPLIPESTPAEAAILAHLLTTAWAAVVADPDVSPFKRVDAFTAKIPDMLEAAKSCRLALTLIETDSHPEAVRAAAAANRAAAAAEEERFRSRGAQMAKSMAARAAAGEVALARAGLARAQAVLDRLGKSDGSDDAIVHAEGAVHMWTARLAKAEADARALKTAPATGGAEEGDK